MDETNDVEKSVGEFLVNEVQEESLDMLADKFWKKLESIENRIATLSKKFGGDVVLEKTYDCNNISDIEEDVVDAIQDHEVEQDEEGMWAGNYNVLITYNKEENNE